ncbi:MAG TPA: hypothetical protein VGI03_01925 [Verrucomicrobiae bacterium]|jgi:hypothetical protein
MANKSSRNRINDPWQSVTWDGARREQLRRWQKLSLREKMEAVEEMGLLAGHFRKARRHPV